MVQLSSEVTLQSSSGNVNIHIPVDSHFDIDVHTSSGKVQLDHPLTITDYNDSKKVKGTVGNGGNAVQIKTSSGNIIIE